MVIVQKQISKYFNLLGDLGAIQILRDTLRGRGVIQSVTKYPMGPGGGEWVGKNFTLQFVFVILLVMVI